MATLLGLVVCSLGAAGALKPRNPPHYANLVRSEILAAPNDTDLQSRKCQELANATQEDRGEPGAYGGRKIAMHWLAEGYAEVASVGLLNIFQAPHAPGATEEDVFNMVQPCFDAITSAQVQNDRDLGLALNRYSPHLWEAFVSYLNRFRLNTLVPGNTPLTMFAGLYASFEGDEKVAHRVDQAGGFKLLLDLMEDRPENAEFIMAAAASLSEAFRWSQVAADAVVRLEGVDRLTKLAQRADGMKHYHNGTGFGFRYVILEDIIGLLRHDDASRKTRDAFVAAGLMEAVTKLMPEEPNDLYFQDRCCQTFSYLANDNVELQRKLAESAAAGLVRQAAILLSVTRFDNTLLLPSCKFTLQNLETMGNSTGWKVWAQP